MATGDETVRLLSRVSLFADLAPTDLEQLAQVAVPRSYVEGEVVFREGDSGDTCFVIRSGAVRVTRRHSDGRIITLAELRLRWHWDPLRDDPRFRKILAGPEPKTVY